MHWRRKKVQFLFFEILIVFLSLSGSSLLLAENENSCPMSNRIQGEMVNIKAARKIASQAGGNVSVLKGFEVADYENCEQECCSNTNCTVYMFYPRPPQPPNFTNQFNCFLLNCRPQNVCALLNVSEKAPEAMVGLRDLSPSPVDNSVVAKTSVQFEGSVNSTQSISPTEGKNASESSDVHQDNNTEAGSMSTKQDLTATSSTIPQSTEESTKLPGNVMQKTKSTNHTTSASLIIALCFGILFLFAVIVLIGRPWCHSFHRPRYSKVDYLMNGL